jgi:hypothetical protein
VNKRRLLTRALPVFIVVLALAGAAAAYFTSTGSGSASGATGTSQNVTLSNATPTAQLYPGGSADISLTVSNPNPFLAHLNSLVLDTSQGTGGFSVDAGHSGCAVSTLSFTSQSNGGTGWDVPPKVGVTNGTLSLDLPNAVSMGTGAANACQGATFTVFLKVGP